MISRKIAEQALAEALRTGGDFAELFLQDERSNAMSLLDGRIENAVTGRLHGAGIRIYKGLNSIYVHTNDTSLSGLIAAARKAADAVGDGSTAEATSRLSMRRYRSDSSARATCPPP